MNLLYFILFDTVNGQKSKIALRINTSCKYIEVNKNSSSNQWNLLTTRYCLKLWLVRINLIASFFFDTIHTPDHTKPANPIPVLGNISRSRLMLDYIWSMNIELCIPRLLTFRLISIMLAILSA